MVSIRCKMTVKAEMDKLGILYGTVDLGEVQVTEAVSAENRERLRAALMLSGLELMDDLKAILIERIKNVIVEMVHYDEDLPKVNNSDYISQKLGYDYTYLANLFSEATGTTIENFIIVHRIERVKELVIYDELSLTEIAWKMNFSSMSHLSNQFKKITGLTPSFFRSLAEKKRRPLEDV